MTDQVSLSEIPLLENSDELDDTEGWKIKKLDDLLENLISGDRPKGGGLEEGDYISIGGTHINSDGRIELDDLVYIKEDFFENVSNTQIQRHDILMTKDGANTGEVAFAWEKKPEIVTNEHILTLRLKEGINPPFVFYFLFSHLGWKQLKGVITGSAQG